MRNVDLKIHTQGLGDPEEMYFSCGIGRCGVIDDGICISLLREHLVGGWVISFKALEQVYLRAKAERED